MMCACQESHEMNTNFEIIVSGYLPQGWSSAFGEMEATDQQDGTTRIAGVLPDQAALYGLLRSLRDWGLTLVSVSPIRQEGGESGETHR